VRLETGLLTVRVAQNIFSFSNFPYEVDPAFSGPTFSVALFSAKCIMYFCCVRKCKNNEGTFDAILDSVNIRQLLVGVYI